MAESVNQNFGREIIHQEECRALGIVGLLHDIGHGPFSHLFEKITAKFLEKEGAHHEKWGERILAEDPELQEIVASNRYLFQVVRDIFGKLHQPIVSDIISSELDADRFDYLLRDSLMTGVQYGNLDLTWILRCLIPTEQEIHKRMHLVLALDATRGTSVVEAYVLGRHYMYKHVYYHRTTRAAEQMLRVILQRATDEIAAERRKSPHPFFDELGKSSPTSLPSVHNYLRLDDFQLLGYVDQWAEEDNPLGEVCRRLRSRRIYKTYLYTEDSHVAEPKIERIKELAKSRGFDPDLFVIPDDASDIALKAPESSKYQPLYFVEPSGATSELAKTKSFVNDLSYKEQRIYVPAELLNDVKDVWNAQ
jgi:HD superfamily phosphohydrolase